MHIHEVSCQLCYPPDHLVDELQQDSITDYWEIDQSILGSTYMLDTRIDYQPIIGILTQPVSASKRDRFNYEDYILEVNDRFVKWAGSRTVAIPYNIHPEELIPLLGQINGVLFTGGGLDLIDPETNE